MHKPEKLWLVLFWSSPIQNMYKLLKLTILTPSLRNGVSSVACQIVSKLQVHEFVITYFQG